MQTNNDISWLEKYRPSNLSEYYISKQQLDVVKTWIKDFRNKSEDAKPFLILHGTAGVGKTTLAYLILKYYDYEIIECNASDTRTKKTIRESIGQISKVSVCIDEHNNFKQVAIIMDEIDGLSGGESSSVQELIDIVTKDKDSKSSVYICPVVCTTNSIKDKKLQPLLKQGVVLNINKPITNDCKKLIDKISKTEQFDVPKIIRNEIIDKANGDYRQIIMLLFEYYHFLKIQNENIIYMSNNPISISNDPISNDSISNDSISNNSISNKPITISKIKEQIYYDEEIIQNETIKKIKIICETPLEKINYFLTNKVKFEDIIFMCSDDSNLYYMNCYINIIQIIYTIQTKSGLKTKDSLLEYYNFLNKIYKLLKDADLFNNPIFLDKYWELLSFFDTLGFALPLKLLHDKNILSNSKYIIPEFNLCHHTQYNFMRQEQSMIRKKLNIDYTKTHNIDVVSIYYNIKRFMFTNEVNISNSKTKKKKQSSKTINKTISNTFVDENKYHIEKLYLKINDKINELLA